MNIPNKEDSKYSQLQENKTVFSSLWENFMHKGKSDLE